MKCLVLVITLSLALGAAEPWQIRYGQLPDQTAEWTALGRIPAWTVAQAPEGDEIALTGDDTGACRGVVFLGRPWVVPASRRAQARLEYQTYCAISAPTMKRSGQVELMAFTPEAWATLATEPAQARVFRPRETADAPLWQVMVHPQGDDVTAWRLWEQAVSLGALRQRAGQTVILAIVWSAYHFDAEWARFRGLELSAVAAVDSDRELLDALNLDLPVLQPVREALDRGDIEAAKAAFVACMRARQTPLLPTVAKDTSASTRRQADNVLKHVFTLVGCPPTPLGETLQWNEDPHHYDQWAIALNRHYHWVTLGQAYGATGDEAYAREFVAEVRSWVEAMPVHIGQSFIEGPYFGAGRTPLSLDAGIRMGQTWWAAYACFKDSPSFDVEAQMLFFRSIREHGLYLADPQGFRASSNWGAMETNGLFHLAALFPELRQAPAWLDLARQRLTELYQAQVYPDGAQKELTPGYHGVTLSNLLGVLETARRNQIRLPEGFAERLEAMFQVYVALALPDGRYPALNDSGWGRVAGALAPSVALFPQRADFAWLASGGRAGAPPERTSWQLPYAGWNVMRSGWGPADRTLLFETGPFSTGHQHEDQLNLILHCGGKTLLTEGGTYSYDASDWRRYVLSSRAHNVVLVDGQPQHRAGRRETYAVDTPYDNRWFSSAEFDVAEGRYDSGFGAQNEIKVIHTRRVLFVKPDYWLVADSFVPPDAVEHTYEALFHLDAAAAQVEAPSAAVSVDDGSTGLRITPLAGLPVTVRIVQGQKEPEVQGWLPTGRHNELRPIPTAVFAWRAAGVHTVVFALLPLTGGQAPLRDLAVLPGSAAGMVAAAAGRADGARDLFAAGSPGVRLKLPGFGEAQAALTLVRLAPAGTVERCFVLP